MVQSRYDDRRGGAGVWVVAAIVLLIVVAAAVYYFWPSSPPEQAAAPSDQVATTPAPAPEPAPAAPTAPAIENPLPPPEAAVPGAPELPTLAQSDGPVKDALTGVVNAKGASEWLNLSDIIRRIVVTVDSIPRESMPMQLRLVKAVPGSLATTGTGDDKVLGEANFARYTPLVRLAETVNVHALAEIYIRFYPLFQQQYRELGYPDGYFNDAMVGAIDNLIRAPEINGPIRLEQPKVLYKFADPSIEGLSIGQRMMVRMGPDNARRVKQVLRGFRQEITGRAPKP